jgi:hypothetical protein
VCVDVKKEREVENFKMRKKKEKFNLPVPLVFIINYFFAQFFF